MDNFGHGRHVQEDTFETDEADIIIGLSNKIALCVTCFSILFLVLAFSYYFFATCAQTRRRRSRRREAIRQLNLSLQQQQQQYHPTEPPTTGLDPALIAALPVFVVESKPQEDHGVGLVEECVVCLSDLEEKQIAKLLPNCNHFFHVDCIDTWLGLHSTCPLCRARVQTRLEPQHREGPIALDGAPPSVVLPVLVEHIEGTTGGGAGEPHQIVGLGSPFGSFRRVLI